MKRLVAACVVGFGLFASSLAQAQQKKDVTWCAPVMGSSYYWDVLSAVELGYMEQEGLNLKLVNNDTPVQGLQFIATGACNIGSITTEGWLPPGGPVAAPLPPCSRANRSPLRSSPDERPIIVTHSSPSTPRP